MVGRAAVAVQLVPPPSSSTGEMLKRAIESLGDVAGSVCFAAATGLVEEPGETTGMERGQGRVSGG